MTTCCDPGCGCSALRWEDRALQQEQAAREEGRIRAGEQALALLSDVCIGAAMGPSLKVRALEVLTSARRCGWEPPRRRA